MKKLLIKSEFITQEYKAPVGGVEAVEAQPEKWVKDDVEVFEQPKLEDGTNDESYTYHPAIEAFEGVEAQPEVPELKEWRVIDQTQGQESELELWLSGNLHKYKRGDIAEYHDLSYEQALQDCMNNRKSEYPSAEEFLNIYFDSNKDFSELELKRLAIKAKYPKPVQGEPIAPVIVELFPEGA